MSQCVSFCVNEGDLEWLEAEIEQAEEPADPSVDECSGDSGAVRINVVMINGEKRMMNDTRSVITKVKMPS